MSGGGARFAWIGEPPLYWKILFFLTLAEFAVGWVLLATLSTWARSAPDASHPIELRMRGGHSYDLSPGVGWYLTNDLWIFFGLLGILALIMFIHRDRVRRVR